MSIQKSRTFRSPAIHGSSDKQLPVFNRSATKTGKLRRKNFKRTASENLIESQPGGVKGLLRQDYITQLAQYIFLHNLHAQRSQSSTTGKLRQYRPVQRLQTANEKISTSQELMSSYESMDSQQYKYNPGMKGSGEVDSVNMDKHDLSDQLLDATSVHEGYKNLIQDINKMNNICQINTQHAQNLEGQLQASKRFLNMVIHDMRAPTTSIKGGLTFVINKLREIKTIYQGQKDFQKKCLVLDQRMSRSTRQSIDYQNLLPLPIQGKIDLKKKRGSVASIHKKDSLNVNQLSRHNMSLRINEPLDSLQHQSIKPDVSQKSYENDLLPILTQSITQTIEQLMTNMENLHAKLNDEADSTVQRIDAVVNVTPLYSSIERKLEPTGHQPKRLNSHMPHISSGQLSSVLFHHNSISPLSRAGGPDSEDDIDEEDMDVDEGDVETKVVMTKANQFTKSKITSAIARIMQVLDDEGLIPEKRDDNQIYSDSPSSGYRRKEIESFLINQIDNGVGTTAEDISAAARSLAAQISGISQKKDVGTQTSDDDGFSMEGLEFMDQRVESLKDIKERHIMMKGVMQEEFINFSLQLANIKMDCQQLQQQNELLKRKMKTQESFYEDVIKRIFEQTLESEKLIQKQVFSTVMSENLINDLLDLAKLENSSFNLSKDYFDLASTIYETFDMLLPNANESQIELLAKIDRKHNLCLLSCILGDQRRYVQILLNFLTNALKFTNNKGTISLELQILDHQLVSSSQEGPDGGINRANSQLSFRQKLASSRSCTDDRFEEGQERYISFYIRVRDTGVGISKEGLANLFIDFSKLQENASRNKAGTGLGLSICKKIIEQMGGSVSVSSEPGVGTEFTVKMKTKCRVRKLVFNEIKKENTKHLCLSDESVSSSSSEKKSDLSVSLVSGSDDSQIRSLNEVQKNYSKRRMSVQICVEQVDAQSKGSSSRVTNVPDFLFIQKGCEDLKLNTRIKKQVNKNIQEQFTKQEKNLLGCSNENKNNYITKKTEFYTHQIDQLIQSQNEGQQQRHQSQQNLLLSLPQFVDIQEQKKQQKNRRGSCGVVSIDIGASSIHDIQQNGSNLNIIVEQRHEGSNKASNSVALSSLSSEEAVSPTNRQRKNSAGSAYRPKLMSPNFIQQSMESTTTPYRCLIANDEAMQLQILQYLFQKKGMEVHTAQNGFQAFEQIQKSLQPEEDPFDLVVLDLNMPISDGYEACTNIRTQFTDLQLFQLSSPRVSTPPKRVSLQSPSDRSHQKQEKRSLQLLDKADFRPLLVACSSQISEEELERTKRAGFDLTYIMPIQVDIIANQILPRLVTRRKIIQKKRALETNDAQDLAESIHHRLEPLSIAESSNISLTMLEESIRKNSEPQVARNDKQMQEMRKEYRYKRQSGNLIHLTHQLHNELEMNVPSQLVKRKTMRRDKMELKKKQFNLRVNKTDLDSSPSNVSSRRGAVPSSKSHFKNQYRFNENT